MPALRESHGSVYKSESVEAREAKTRCQVDVNFMANGAFYLVQDIRDISKLYIYVL